MMFSASWAENMWKEKGRVHQIKEIGNVAILVMSKSALKSPSKLQSCFLKKVYPRGL